MTPRTRHIPANERPTDERPAQSETSDAWATTVNLANAIAWKARLIETVMNLAIAGSENAGNPFIEPNGDRLSVDIHLCYGLEVLAREIHESSRRLAEL